MALSVGVYAHDVPITLELSFVTCLLHFKENTEFWYIMQEWTFSFLFQMESGGTVLSTNWSDVGKRKVEINPPDDMEWKQY